MPPQNWRTPPQIFQTLQKSIPSFYPDFTAFAVDLACDQQNKLAPLLPRCNGQDGYDSFLQLWDFAEPAWCNPPWNDVSSFVYRAVKYNTKVCFLLPGGRIDQTWFQFLVQHAHIEIFAGRVSYIDPLSLGRTQPREGSIVAWVGSVAKPGISSRFRSNQTGEYCDMRGSNV